MQFPEISFYVVSHGWILLMIKITDRYFLFKWHNFHNLWLPKNLFALLYVILQNIWCFSKIVRGLLLLHHSPLMSVIGCKPSNLHWNRFDGEWDSILPPGVPKDACPLPLVLVGVFGGTIEVCQSTLVEPPPCVVVHNAATLHCPVSKAAWGVAPIIVHIWGTEWSRVLVLFLIIATESIACTKTHAHNTT